MRLNDIRDNKGAHQKTKRVGRGIGSGMGKTSTGGQKGQKARTGVSLHGFEGGQNPIYRRLPKRGFHNINRVEMPVVNTGDMQKAIDAGRLKADQITLATLIETGLVNRKATQAKLLARGALTSAVQITIDRASPAAVEMVKKAKGSVTLKAPVAEAPAKA